MDKMLRKYNQENFSKTLYPIGSVRGEHPPLSYRNYYSSINKALRKQDLLLRYWLRGLWIMETRHEGIYLGFFFSLLYMTYLP